MEKLDKIKRPLAKLTKNKNKNKKEEEKEEGEEIQITKARYKRGDIAIVTMNIKRIIKEYYK